jgi:hypothetical protein
VALVVLRRFDSSIEASLARSFLASDGIMSFLFDVMNEWDTIPRISMPVRLMVAEEDLDDAMLLLGKADASGAVRQTGAS